jgi:DNA-binding NtrC family response regulator
MGQKILALDDEPHMLRLLERIISEKTPYEIVSTGNPLEVPALLEKEQFALIITDLKMPGMDGLDILRLVKERGVCTEVIIMTAFGSLETATQALSEGVFDYITKPFNKEQIILSVDRALRCQATTMKAARIAMLLDLLPYKRAEESFRREYVRKLHGKLGNDIDAIQAQSGLPAEQIEGALRNES